MNAAVRAHYYIYGIPRVTACAVLNEALLFCRQAYGDPKLGAVAVEIRFTAGDLGGLSWKQAFDRALAGHHRYGSRWIEPNFSRNASPPATGPPRPAPTERFQRSAPRLNFSILMEGARLRWRG